MSLRTVPSKLFDTGYTTIHQELAVLRMLIAGPTILRTILLSANDLGVKGI
jgi:hypothetical protein